MKDHAVKSGPEENQVDVKLGDYNLEEIWYAHEPGVDEDEELRIKIQWRFSQVRKNLTRMKLRKLRRSNLKKESKRSGQTITASQKAIVTMIVKTILTGV